MTVFFLFLDGVGLGADDPAVNPLVRAAMPNLQTLLAGRRMTKDAAPCENGRATLLALDANLGVPGLPQSATGQAVLLTGENVPAALGHHYGPKPNPAVTEHLKNGTLFSRMKAGGKRAGLLNAYPPRYFHGIQSGRRMYSAIPLAVTHAGIPLHTAEDLYAGRALSADFTGAGWRERLGYADAPVLTPNQAGAKMAALAGELDFAMFEYWPSDYARHGQEMDAAVGLLEVLDGVLGGVLEAWSMDGGGWTDDRGRTTEDDGLILITSDHGNMEDLFTRRHTTNKVACLLIGTAEARRGFAEGLVDLTGIAAGIEKCLQRTDAKSAKTTDV